MGKKSKIDLMIERFNQRRRIKEIVQLEAEIEEKPLHPERNRTIAIIIISVVSFVILGLIGGGIYWAVYTCRECRSVIGDMGDCCDSMGRICSSCCGSGNQITRKQHIHSITKLIRWYYHYFLSFFKKI